MHTTRRYSKLLSAVLSTALMISSAGCVSVQKEKEPISNPDNIQEVLMNSTGSDKPFTPVVGKKGGKRTIASNALPKTFNYYLAAETSSTDILEKMYLGLITSDPVTAEIIPSLAKSWELSEDKMTYTFHLREGLKWSDGHPITSDDVVFTFNEIINNPKVPNNSKDGMLVDDKFPTIKKIDDLTLTVTTAKPFVPFLRTVGQGIMPKHVFEGTTQPDASGDVKFNTMWGLNTDVSKVVVSGPWKIKEYKTAQYIILEPNPHYYEKDAEGNSLPYLDEFVTIRVQDLNSSVVKFKSGETDAYAMRAEDYDIIKEVQKEQNLAIKNLGPATGTTFVMFNMSTAKNKEGQPVVDPVKSKWFKNVKFRQAMAHAINKTGIIKSIYKGRAIPQYSHISQQNPFYDPTTKDYEYNLNKAAEMLKEAGFVLKKDELYDADGNRVEFNLVTNSGNTQRDATCAILRKDWGKLGIKVNYKPVEFNAMVQQLDQTLDWEAMMIGLTGSAVEPHGGINSWRLDGRMHMFNMGNKKSGWEGRGETSFEPWEHKMIELYEKASLEFDPEKRKALYAESQHVAAENLPFLFTVNQLALVGYNKRLGNVRAHIRGGSSLNRINWNTERHYIQQ